MFKKTFSILAAFVFGLVISISILACADDISDYSGNDVDKELAERILALEKEVTELKNAKNMQNIGSYSEDSDSSTVKATYEYDDEGRIIKGTYKITFKFDGHSLTDVWTCSYKDNVCTVKCDDRTHIFTLENDKSRDFSTIQQIITSWIID